MPRQKPSKKSSTSVSFHGAHTSWTARTTTVIDEPAFCPLPVDDPTDGRIGPRPGRPPAHPPRPSRNDHHGGTGGRSHVDARQRLAPAGANLYSHGRYDRQER